MYDNDSENIEAPEPLDRRLALMQQYVALDRERDRVAYDRKQIASKSAKIDEEFERVSDQLREALGFGDPMASAKRSLDVEVRGLR